jgi:hypothetical protein
MAFTKSERVTTIRTGRVRDDKYDEIVSAAYADKGTVFEDTFPDSEIDDVRRGLARSAQFLKVRLGGPEYSENGNGTTTVYFSAHDKMPRNGSRKVETATADATAVETADAGTESEPEKTSGPAKSGRVKASA